MAVIDLGTISPKKTSLFKVSATTTVSNVALNYTYASGRLPQGLSLQPDGEIIGECGPHVFEIDQGETTFDFAQTTADRSHTFTVNATDRHGQSASSQDFSIDVVKKTNDVIANMYGNIRPDRDSLKSFQNLVFNTKVFANATLYRPTDPNFATALPKFLFLAGVHLKLLKNIQALLANNNYNFNLRIGDYKLAKAKDQVGTTLYEVIYAELIDPNSGANNSIVLKSHNLPNITIQLRTSSLEITSDHDLTVPGLTEDELYSNDIVNMQNELKAGLTVENFEYLPLWMKTGVTGGFKLALPIRYLQPGAGEQALYRLQNEITYDLKNLHIDVDRWLIDNNLGTTFDNLDPLIHSGDGSTTIFSIPTQVARKNNLLITVDNIGIKEADITLSTTADTNAETSDISGLLTNDELSGTQIEFDVAPQNGAVISIRLKPTTFEKHTVTRFDADVDVLTADSDGKTADTLDTLDNTIVPASATKPKITTFDGRGTRFIGPEVTFDRKINPEWQLMFSKSSVTDGITHLSKQRELVRTV